MKCKQCGKVVRSISHWAREHKKWLASRPRKKRSPRSDGSSGSKRSSRKSRRKELKRELAHAGSEESFSSGDVTIIIRRS